MVHRHLNHDDLTLAAIDDLILRGNRTDWERLRAELLSDPELAEKIRQVCQPHIVDPYQQRYHFWLNYVQYLKQRTA